MAAAGGSSQHRCVFVGNIPYDATEEQLIQICEEVGPVVSFRLVLDRETGKPKGYGFCEYKDEETALSARRNLQGYEINGRQLRVDFAENDKNADRNREQGRGGPGLTSNVDANKAASGSSILGDSALHQPIGLPLASTAASDMAGALGGAQTASFSIQNGSKSQTGLGNDPLTHYLARMSRYQLNEVVSEMKVLATKNPNVARQLLQGSSQLPRAIFQAQIMLGMVSPQMMASIQHSSSLVQHPSLQDGIQLPKPTLPSHRGPTPLQKESQVGILSRPEGPASTVLQNPSIVQQSSAPFLHAPGQPQLQTHLSSQAQTMILGTMPGLPGAPGPTSLRPHSLGSIPVPEIPPLPTLKGQNSQFQAPPQHGGSFGASKLGHHAQLAVPETTTWQPLLHPFTSQTGSSNYQVLQGRRETFADEARTTSLTPNSTWVSRNSTQPMSGAGFMEQAAGGGDMPELMGRPSKLARLEVAVPSHANTSLNNPFASAPAHSVGNGSLSGNQTVGIGMIQQSDKHVPQLPPEVQSDLLQQVMNLTPEQLNLLPQEQRDQVLAIQKAMGRKPLAALHQ